MHGGALFGRRHRTVLHEAGTVLHLDPGRLPLGFGRLLFVFHFRLFFGLVFRNGADRHLEGPALRQGPGQELFRPLRIGSLVDGRGGRGLLPLRIRKLRGVFPVDAENGPVLRLVGRAVFHVQGRLYRLHDPVHHTARPGDGGVSRQQPPGFPAAADQGGGTVEDQQMLGPGHGHVEQAGLLRPVPVRQADFDGRLRHRGPLDPRFRVHQGHGYS